MGDSLLGLGLLSDLSSFFLSGLIALYSSN